MLPRKKANAMQDQTQYDAAYSVIETEVFKEDCKNHNFSEKDINDFKVILLLNPDYGRDITFTKSEKAKFKTDSLRTAEWVYDRGGVLVKANILFVRVPKVLPMYLLRLHVDDAGDDGGPFSNPQSWSRWAELLGELTEITLRHWA